MIICLLLHVRFLIPESVLRKDHPFVVCCTRFNPAEAVDLAYDVWTSTGLVISLPGSSRPAVAVYVSPPDFQFHPTFAAGYTDADSTFQVSSQLLLFLGGLTVTFKALERCS